MSKKDKILLDLLAGEEIDRQPIWLMRQAGRYLPEYRELRAKAERFLDLCLTPELAAEATLQPLRRFRLDASIVFADILLVPYALEQRLDFKENIGPVLDPITHEDELTHLRWNVEVLAPVFKTLEIMKEELPEGVTRLGFAGGLWTVACYMIEGQSKMGFGGALAATERNTAFLRKLIDLLYHVTLEYLARQIESGAEAIQLFDSWAGLLDGQSFQRWVIEPTRKLVHALKQEYPSVPVIGFPRGACPQRLRAYLQQTGVDALGIGSETPLNFAKDELQPIKPLQGNLSPDLLVEGGAGMKDAAELIKATFGSRHIFNLGHGVKPETPVEHVQELVDFINPAPAFAEI